MKVENTAIPEVLLITPTVFGDDRGFFYESYNHKVFNEKTGLNLNFVQDNHSRSQKNVLRGLHYQIGKPQGKLIRVLRGAIQDVAVDLRRSSPTFAKSVSYILSEENRQQLWIPEGFAHGFVVLSDIAEVVYKTTAYYAPSEERCIIWNDPDIAIAWQIEGQPILSTKDTIGKSLKEAELFS
ncbi:dTDP-4-dehydrorhamnose 3,5-epimerase [Pseudanabaena sp. FACHB-1998]|uniref:dTDP-4-dehydrorhamnose 3,5-epimerase n=1 Tax=Pseudanabaena sp. FACHB-1998 TaxID=2692858 RepID=UPI0016815545|nr:dTDP-4-dehydrorhamnose 3,5-epimerase [Pseudanabaena sp. FACHB-1998]MBD2177243.1 dTDP-4-dehydrorhamnose 3,5-epimerase [Pseudanabaena sp. FACHB-1998]